MNDSDSNLAWNEVLTGTDGIAGGVYSQQAQSAISELLRGAQVRLTTSGTDALELASIAAGVGPGDTVLVPSFGFVTTALAFVRSGARIRFVDVELSTLGMDPGDLVDKLDPTVKAIVPIHYAGIACDIDAIVSATADLERALVIEDAAHAFLGSVDERPLGTVGALGCFSFHGTKNVSCGEGGAVVINDPALIDRVEVVLEKGTDRRSFLRGEVDKYTWRDLGSSFGMSDYLAGLLLLELRKAEWIQSRRRSLTERYLSVLADESNRLGFSLPMSKRGDTSAYHLFYVLLDDPRLRDGVLSDLHQADVRASFHYPPLHRTPGGRTWGDGAAASCPNSELVADSIIRLPLDQRMTEDEADRAASVLVESLEFRGVA